MSFSRLTWGVHFVSWTLSVVAQLATTASQTLHAYTGTIPIVFIKHIIVPRHDRLRNNIKSMQPHFNVQPLAR